MHLSQKQQLDVQDFAQKVRDASTPAQKAELVRRYAQVVHQSGIYEQFIDQISQMLSVTSNLQKLQQSMTKKVVNSLINKDSQTCN